MRAGLSMVESMLDLIPNCAVHHIGIYNDKTSCCPILYYNKLPKKCDADIAIVLEPMIASGSTLHATIKILKDWGCKKIVVMAVVASQAGVDLMSTKHPDVTLHVGAIDDRVTSNGMVFPGLGDVGDRLYNGKSSAESIVTSPHKKRKHED